MQNQFNTKTISNKIINVPLSLSGLGLGMAGLGNAWSAQLKTPEFYNNNSYDFSILNNTIISIQSIAIFITLICFVLVLTRIFLNLNLFKKEMNEPMLNSFFPTLWMNLTCIANYIGFVSTFNQSHLLHIVNAGTIVANIVMIIAIFLQCLFLLFFLFFIFKKHSFRNHVAYASWFIPTVGIAISCIFVDNLGNLIPIEFFQLFWYVGLTLYILLFPLITYKIIFFNNIPTNRLPTLGIYLSAPNLLLLGSFTMFTQKYTPYYSNTFVYSINLILFFFCIFSILFFTIVLIKILKIRFIPLFASLTYPTAITATSNIRMAQFINSTMMDVQSNNQFLLVFEQITSFFGFLFLLLSTIIISYIFICFFIYIKKIFCPCKENNIKLI